MVFAANSVKALTESRLYSTVPNIATTAPKSQPTSGQSADSDDISQALGRLQRLLASRRVADSLVDAAGLALSQQAVQVLRALGGQDEISVATLARIAQMDVGAVSRQLSALEEAKLIRRKPNPTNKSIVLVSPTAKGREIATRADRVRRQHLVNVLESWNPEERERFGELFTRFVSDLQHTPLPDVHQS